MSRALLLVILTAIPAMAAAQGTRPPPTGARRHDGVYVRGHAGPGYLTAGSGQITMSGIGILIGIRGGYTVARNLVVYGEVFDDFAINPTVDVGHVELEASGPAAGAFGGGVGVGYFFMPDNVSISITLAASKLTIRSDAGDVAETKIGPSLNTMAGKEWWVADDWAIGAAFLLVIGSMGDQREGGASFSSVSVGVAFTATYN